MNRRSFLTALGLAPVVAAVPAMGTGFLRVGESGPEMIAPFKFKDGQAIIRDAKISLSCIESVADATAQESPIASKMDNIQDGISA